MAVSPTSLSLRHLRAEGWTVDVCERWMASSRTRRDLFGLIDLVALRGNETMGVQTTSAGNANARLNKMTDAVHRPYLDALLGAGWSVVIHGWRLSTRDGHACQHGKARCGCRWTLHRYLDLGKRAEEPMP